MATFTHKKYELEFTGTAKKNHSGDFICLHEPSYYVMFLSIHCHVHNDGKEWKEAVFFLQRFRIQTPGEQKVNYQV